MGRIPFEVLFYNFEYFPASLSLVYRFKKNDPLWKDMPSSLRDNRIDLSSDDNVYVHEHDGALNFRIDGSFENIGKIIKKFSLQISLDKIQKDIYGYEKMEKKEQTGSSTSY